MDQISEGCGIAESDLLTVPPTCHDLVESNYIEIPIGETAFSDSCNQSIEIQYKGTPGTYLDLKNSQIHLTCVLLQRDGSPVPDKAKVGVVNHLGE